MFKNQKKSLNHNSQNKKIFQRAKKANFLKHCPFLNF